MYCVNGVGVVKVIQYTQFAEGVELIVVLHSSEDVSLPKVVCCQC